MQRIQRRLMLCGVRMVIVLAISLHIRGNAFKAIQIFLVFLVLRTFEDGAFGFVAEVFLLPIFEEGRKRRLRPIGLAIF